MGWAEPRSFPRASPVGLARLATAEGLWPRAIMHIDGDSFFASCEVVKNPALRGKPVITGRERGIVSSMTYEAKRLGIKRSMPLHEIRKKFPQAVILPSDYETYSIFSRRMYEIVRRYTPTVEEYSIDECFAELTGLRRVHHASYPDIAARIKKDLERELGMTFGVGLSATKVLAKIGSKWNKPAGLTTIPLGDMHTYLEKTPIGSVWGIGPNTSAYLQKFRVTTALEFARKPEAWVVEKLSKPYIEIWKELNGEVVNELDAVGRATYQSISKTKTFTPPSRDSRFVFSQLSKNIENACIKARRWKLASSQICVFLKTQDFTYSGCEITLPIATNVPQDIVRHIAVAFAQLFTQGLEYRATGITLCKLQDEAHIQLDLFGAATTSQVIRRVFQSVDEICERFGKHTMFLGSSFGAMTREIGAGERGGPSTGPRDGFRGETARRRLGIALLGDVS